MAEGRRTAFGHADRVDGAHEVWRARALLGERGECGRAHPRHDAHRGGHVGRVGELHAHLRDRAARRAHRERHHVPARVTQHCDFGTWDR